MARRLGDRCIFAGFVHATTNLAGAQPLVHNATVHLDWTGDGKTEIITLPMRRQGSVYEWDRSVTPPTLVQLDRWHEPWHPWWWSRDFRFDAEVDDGRVAGASGVAWTVYTDAPNAPDYTGFVTSLRVTPSTGATWEPPGPGGTAGAQPLAAAPVARCAFQPRTAVDLHAWVRARVRDGGSATVYLSVADGTPAEQTRAIEVDKAAWAARGRPRPRSRRWGRRSSPRSRPRPLARPRASRARPGRRPRRHR